MKNPEMIKAGTGEKMQYMVHTFNDNTIRFVLLFCGKIDAKILEKATAKLVDGADILHASFRMEKKDAYWLVNDDYRKEDYFLQVVAAEGCEAQKLFEMAVEDAQLPVLPEGKVQLHCSLFEGNGNSAISVRISHLCVDGSDGKYLLGKLTEAYNGILRNGNADDLYVKNGSRAPEQVYESLSRAEVKTLLSNPMTGIKTAFPFQNDAPGEKHIVWKAIPEELMESARNRAKMDHATVNDILLTACYHAFAQLPDIDRSEAFSIQSFMDLRKHCKSGDSEGLTNLSGSLATVMPDGIGDSFSETLKQVAEQTAKAKEDPLAGLEGMPLLHGAVHLMPLKLLLKAAGRLYGSFSIGLTNIGNVDCIEMGNCKVITGLFGGPMKKKPGAQVCAASFKGSTVLCVAGEFNEEDAILLQNWLDGMEEEIRKYALDLTIPVSCDSL